METGSDLGSEPTAAHEPLNLTLDLEYAHVSGHVCPQAASTRLSSPQVINRLEQLEPSSAGVR